MKGVGLFPQKTETFEIRYVLKTERLKKNCNMDNREVQMLLFLVAEENAQRELGR